MIIDWTALYATALYVAPAGVWSWNGGAVEPPEPPVFVSGGGGKHRLFFFF